MEIKGTSLNGVRGKPSETPRIGNLLRIKVLKKINARHVLVRFHGKNHFARIARSIPTDLFIAQVQRLKPQLQLKFVRDLARTDQPLNKEVLSGILAGKKPLIQKLFTSDNFGEALSIFVKEDRREIKTSLKRSISRRNIVSSLSRTREEIQYLLLENLHNFMSSDSFFLLLPLLVGRRRFMAELRFIGNRENAGNGILLNIQLDDETRISFLVYIDFDSIQCTLSTNSIEIERVLRENIHILQNGLKSLKYDRRVKVRFVPYSEDDGNLLGSLKKIDVEM
jgi:hypothetical protein